MTPTQRPIFQLIAKDQHVGGPDGSWNWMAVIHFTGELETDPEDPHGGCVTDDQVAEIYKFLEGYDIHVQSAGSGAPGQPFANEPWIQYFPNHLIITQSGGLDV